MIKQVNQLALPISKYLKENANLIAPLSTHSLLAATFVDQNPTDKPLLLVTTSTRKADELSAEISSYLINDLVTNFPPWETLPHERLSPKSDTITPPK